MQLPVVLLEGSFCWSYTHNYLRHLTTHALLDSLCFSSVDPRNKGCSVAVSVWRSINSQHCNKHVDHVNQTKCLHKNKVNIIIIC